ncbi:MAG TPA: hypothetical protein VI564_07080 [Candidatus Nanoarchaeia archaeon]|nr:hypothetical protein [Candidatus Nanoarchaeia archaeon]
MALINILNEEVVVEKQVGKSLRVIRFKDYLLYNTLEAGEMIGVSGNTVKTWCNKGYYPTGDKNRPIISIDHGKHPFNHDYISSKSVEEIIKFRNESK